MATLNKIRSKAGLLVVIIGVALLAFIVGDFLNSGHTFYAMNQNKVAVVNGTNIGVEEFQERVKVRTDELQQMYGQRGMTLPEGYVSRINQEVYDQMVNEILLSEELEELGIVVSKEELADLLSGDNISPQVRQYFTNPQTGEFDRQGLLNFMQVVLDPESHGYNTPELLAQIEPQRQMWLRLEQEVKQNRAVQKFANLLNRAIMPNKLDLENSFEDNKTSANIAYALQPYTSIADSTIAVSDGELKAEYNKMKSFYKTPERRSIKYITVNIVPSEADYAKAKEKAEMNESVFATTDDVVAFIANNSDESYDDSFVAISSMPEKMKKFAQTASVNESSPMEFENDTYTMYRLMDTKVAPDSIKVRLLSFQPRSTEIDSVLNVLNHGGSFAELAPKYNGNDEIWLMENMASSGMTKWIRISLNPSSWFANQFVDFYNETYEKKYHFQVTTAGVQSVMERVRDYMDDIGFVYILSQQKENFLYELSKNKMHFEPIYETDVMLYPGGLTELYNSGKERAELEDLEGIRFIQNYQDEFFDIGAVKEDAFQWKDIDISVLTNSDYIMEKMLKNSKVANISGSYLSENKEGTTPGIPLDLGDSKVIFGFILHKGEEMDESVAELVEFLKSRLPKH